MTALRRALAATAVAAMTATVMLVPVDIAGAKGSDGPDRTQVTAGCGAITTRLALRVRNAGGEAEYQLDENHAGTRWRLTMTRNGLVVARGARVTRGPSGSLSWRVVTAGATATDRVQVTARHRGTRCVLRARIAAPTANPTPGTTPGTTPSALPSAVPTPAPSSTATGTPADTIEVSKCYTNATASSGGEMLIKAASSDPQARLFAYRPDGTLIGEVQNGGGSRYGGSVMPYQPYDPGTVTITSTSGGRVTVRTGPFQL